MSKKLKMNPSVSYVLGVYGHCEQEERSSMQIIGKNERIVEKFVKIVLDEYGLEPNKLLISDGKDGIIVKFYNSKLRKLCDNALQRREKLFAHANDYAAEYIAGMFDACGGRNAKGLFIINLDSTDYNVLENLGLHTMQQGSKHYIISQTLFMKFVGRYSEALKSMPVKSTG